MTPEIVLTLAILLVATVLFITDKLRVDLVALLVLVTLTVTGLVTPAEALSGFSNPAVVTIWAVFILSAGLTATGVAQMIGAQMLRISGRGEARLLLVIMLTTAIISNLMTNVGLVALLLPVVLIISRKTEIPPSRLLLPLATGTLLGGTMTIFGSLPNILVSDALRDAGFAPFHFFSFLPTGALITLVGTAFVVLIGRHLLPRRHPVQELAGYDRGQLDAYDLGERMTIIEIPPESPIAGKTLAESRIGHALGLTILGVQRKEHKQMDIQPETVLCVGDQLLALGRLDRLEELRRKPYLILDEHNGLAKQLYSQEIALAEWTLNAHSPFIGRSISDINVRHNFGFNVLAIRQNGQIRHSDLQDVILREGDRLLLQGKRERLTAVGQLADFDRAQLRLLSKDQDPVAEYDLYDFLLWMHIPMDSPIDGLQIAESHLAEVYDLLVLAVVRGGEVILAPPPDFVLEKEDLLLVLGEPEELAIVRGLQGLVVLHHINVDKVELESEHASLVEAVLAPRSNLVNKSLREIHFREKYDLSVLAIWRNGRPIRSELGNLPLRFGDAFLIYGPQEKIHFLAQETDFILLSNDLEEPPRLSKAPLAIAIMIGVIVVVMAGWLPIAIAAVAGAALMVISGCLPMDEAYSSIEWRAVFLIAGMLPLGIALANTGTAQFLANQMIALVGDKGQGPLLAGFFILTSLAVLVIPKAVVTVIMAPIALSTASDLGYSPYALMIVIAISAQVTLMSPVGQPTNILVMSPGGYSFGDFLKTGIPLTILILIVTVLIVPVFWPM